MSTSKTIMPASGIQKCILYLPKLQVIHPEWIIPEFPKRFKIKAIVKKIYYLRIKCLFCHTDTQRIYKIVVKNNYTYLNTTNLNTVLECIEYFIMLFGCNVYGDVFP